jgi:putative zinc finger protein
MRCEQARELAPEIALGIVDGEERAEALRHLSTCAECRRAVDGLSQVADELLMLAPVQEPPPGFESRVAEGLGLRPRARRRPRRLSVRWLAPRLGPALAAAAVTAAVLVGVYHDDHQTAARYRETLAQAGGQYFQAELLADRNGTRGGIAFGYEGSPSWVLVTVDAGRRDGLARGELVTRDGRTIALPKLELDRNGSWGGAIPVNLYKVASIRLLGDSPGETLEASFPRGVTEGN